MPEHNEYILSPPTSNIHFYTSTAVILYGFLSFLFKPHREIASSLHQAYQSGMKVGDVQSATYALMISIRFSFFSGEHLRVVSEEHARSLPIIVSISYLSSFSLNFTHQLLPLLFI